MSLSQLPLAAAILSSLALYTHKLSAGRTRLCCKVSKQSNLMQGNRTCDICKTMVKNLPEVPPQLPDSATTQNGFDENGEMLRNNALILSEQTPSGADVVFDCIRVILVCGIKE